MPARPQRLVVSFCSLGLALAFVAAGSAALDEAARSGSAQAPALRFTSGSLRVVAGQAAFVAVAVRPVGVRCSAAVRYANGGAQSGLKPIRAVNGHARWTWRLAEKAAPGAASVTVACDRVGRRSRALMVVRPPIPASVVVVKQGFSQRLSRSGTSSSLSFGVILANPSPDQDALDVTVLVNAIDASNRVVQTATARVAGVAAASSFGTAGQMSLGTAPVSRLELVVQLGARVPKTPLVYPVLANAQIVPSRFDKGYIGGVDGELV
nr:hypothetical protein [Actinomycetota bacterium]